MQIRIVLADGRRFESEPARARGNPENPLSDDELRAKYRDLATPVLGVERATRIEWAVDALATDGGALSQLQDDVLRANAQANGAGARTS